MGKQAFEGPGVRGQVFNLPPEEIVVIGLDTEDGPEHPLWDKRLELPVDEGLARNIKTHGVLQAIMVRKNGGRAEVIVGRQRVKAAREANRRRVAEGLPPLRVPCQVRKGEGDGGLIALGFSENHHRRDASPMDNAEHVRRLLAMGYDEEGIADMWSVDRSTVQRYAALLDLVPQVQAMVAGGKLGAVAASKLAKYPRGEQVAQAKDLIAAGGTAAAARARESARAKGGRASDAIVPPAKTMVKRVLKANEEAVRAGDDDATLSADFVAGLQWAMGLRDARSVRGLSALIRRANGKG